MIDDTFHLTALDVRRYEFGRALRGYDPERVDQFREQVAEELERLARLSSDLEARARGVDEQLRSFRDRDTAINEALVTAQQLRADIKAQAEKEAELVLREARAEAERVLAEGRAEARRLEGEVAAVERMRQTYLAQLRMYAERQLAEIAAAEGMAPRPAEPGDTE